ncbi:DUF5022 domain-containing protein [Paenibacillus assamensis]|uniref:DUF5022 domain-containing protein n=1 Tax=Paenibacillus assamensis TaxID=311244 RepID=UPI000404F9EE|nr:DUF5022 domain-containing protein [Paenibacillus assamensis]
MKKKTGFKKLFVLVLTCCVILSSTTGTAYATEQGEQDLKPRSYPEKINVQLQGHGEYHIIENTNKSFSNESDGTEATFIAEDRMYKLQDGRYLSVIDENRLQQVNKIEINLSDTDSINNIAETYSLSDDIKKDLLAQWNKMKAQGKTDAKAAVFTPTTPTIATLSNPAPYYYKYDNKMFRDTQIIYYNVDTMMQEIKSGVGTKEVAKVLKDITLEVVGNVQIVAKIMPLLNAATSVFNAFLELIGYQEIRGSYQDMIQVGLKYDIYKKYTDVNVAMDLVHWQSGARTQSTTIKKIDTRAYFIVGNQGVTHEFTKHSYEIYETPNWSKSWIKANQNYPWMAWNEQLQIKIFNVPIIF